MSGKRQWYTLWLQVLVLLCALTCGGLVDSAAASGQGSWKALIIGIGKYQDRRVKDLRTPVHDGRELATVLSEQYGFEVATLFDGEATWQNIDNALRRLVSESTPGDSVLIYYGGHGDLDRELDEGWWYPVDSVPGKRQTYLKNSDLRELIKNMEARHVLLVSDSCFAGSLFGNYRSFSPSLIDDRYHQRLYNEKSRLGLTSGGKEPVLDGGSEGHSIFAYHLLKYLKSTEKKVFSAGELYAEIAPVVTNNSPQKPQFLPILYTGHENGEFVFIRSGADIINYVSLDVAATPEASGSEGRGFLWPGSGLALGCLLVSLLVIPRAVYRQREKDLRRAVASRDAAAVQQLLEKVTPRDEKLARLADTITSTAAGIVLERGRQQIVIAPGPQQGLGRGDGWPLAISDPHISRKPHGWLLLNGGGGVSLNSDGGEVVVNGQTQHTCTLQQGDVIALGPLTELLVEKVVPDMGALLQIQSGPDTGKRLVLLGSSAPLNWLTGQLGQAGSLSWQDQRFILSVGEKDSHPLPGKKELSDFPLLAGDILQIDGQGWQVRLI